MNRHKGFRNQSFSKKRRHLSLQKTQIRGERFSDFHCENPEKLSRETHLKIQWICEKIFWEIEIETGAETTEMETTVG